MTLLDFFKQCKKDGKKLEIETKEHVSYAVLAKMIHEIIVDLKGDLIGLMVSEDGSINSATFVRLEDIETFDVIE